MAATHNFTLRLPRDLYVEIYELSVSQDKTLNATVIDLVKIALTQKVDIRRALEMMLDREFGTNAITAQS